MIEQFRSFATRKKLDFRKVQVSHLVEALLDIQTGYGAAREAVKGNSWFAENADMCEEGTTTRQQGALDLLATSDRQTFATEGIRKLSMLRVHYEIDRLKSIAVRKQTTTGQTETLVAAAEREFLSKSTASQKDVRSIRDSCCTSITASQRKSGLGLLLMLGCSSRRLWERKLDRDNARIFCEFYEDSFKHMASIAARLQDIACEILRNSLMRNAISPAELEGDGHIFTHHFREVLPREDLQSLYESPYEWPPCRKCLRMPMVSRWSTDLLDNAVGCAP